MGLPAHAPVIDAEGYLALDRDSQERHEYVDGDIFAMTGASRHHNLITLNTAASLHGQLQNRPCEIYNNDMRVSISPQNTYVYPDIVVVCHKPEFIDTHLDTLLNPLLIIEVLSSSTEAYDRGKKFVHYRSLESLQAYVLIAQEEARVEYYQRGQAGQWVLSETSDLESVIHLDVIDCQLALADVYAKVAWSDAAE